MIEIDISQIAAYLADLRVKSGGSLPVFNEIQGAEKLVIAAQ